MDGRSRHRNRWRKRAGDRLAASAWRGAAIVTLAGTAVMLAPAVPAQAHPPGTQAAVDYRTRVTAITPAVAGVQARYVADGSRLELGNDSGRTIEVIGYQGEPMLQVRPDGVWQNTHAPSLYVDKLGTAINPAADAHAAPQWQRISNRPLARWQDHRALWHGSPPPPVRADPTRAHRVSNWRVPLHDGAATLEITGTLDWVPPPEPGQWWAAVLLVAAAIAALGLVASTTDSRARVVRAGLAGSAVVVGLVVAGYPLLVVADNAEPEAGSIALALLSQAVPVLLGLALMAAGVLVLARRDVGDFGLAFSGICAVLFVGAPDAALFSHAVAPIQADGQWARLAIATVLGGGTGLVVAGALRMYRSTRTTNHKPSHEAG
jgi:hypothetical protein